MIQDEYAAASDKIQGTGFITCVPHMLTVVASSGLLLQYIVGQQQGCCQHLLIGSYILDNQQCNSDPHVIRSESWNVKYGTKKKKWTKIGTMST